MEGVGHKHRGNFFLGGGGGGGGGGGWGGGGGGGVVGGWSWLTARQTLMGLDKNERPL